MRRKGWVLGEIEEDPEGSGIQERLPKALFNTSKTVHPVGQGKATLLKLEKGQEPTPVKKGKWD